MGAIQKWAEEMVAKLPSPHMLPALRDVAQCGDNTQDILRVDEIVAEFLDWFDRPEDMRPIEVASREATNPDHVKCLRIFHDVAKGLRR